MLLFVDIRIKTSKNGLSMLLLFTVKRIWSFKELSSIWSISTGMSEFHIIKKSSRKRFQFCRTYDTNIVCVCVCVCVCQLNWIKCYPFLRIRLTKVASCTTSGALYGGETPTPSGSPEFTICFSDVHLAQFLVRLLFPFLSIFFWPLYCLPFFDLRLSINPLLFSNFSFD